MKARQTNRKQSAFCNATKKLRELIFSGTYKGRARKRPEDFTRNRKMTFTHMIHFMLNQIKSSTQTVLETFFDLIGMPDIHMSEQSFSEARQKIKWEAFRELMDFSVECAYRDGYCTWHGYRVLAVDGSKLQLPSDQKLREIFGTAGRGDTAVTAQSSCLYDVFNDILVDAQIAPMATDERTLAVKHIQHLCSLDSFSRELVILDRGYPSFDLIALFEQKKTAYLMRVRTKFNCDIDEMPIGEHRYTLVKDGKQLLLRVVKFLLPSGEIETLITNLFDKRMGTKAFMQLYFKRWPIETKYGELKHKLEIENFSGRTKDAIFQDYYITAFLSNMISIAENEVQPIIDHSQKDKENLYAYKVNKNHAVGVFKDRFILALLEPRPRKRDRAVKRIFFLLSKHPTPVRPGRSVPRNPNPRDAHFHFNYKSNC